MSRRIRSEPEASAELEGAAGWYEDQRASDAIDILAFAHERREPSYWHDRIVDARADD